MRTVDRFIKQGFFIAHVCCEREDVLGIQAFTISRVYIERQDLLS